MMTMGGVSMKIFLLPLLNRGGYIYIYIYIGIHIHSTDVYDICIKFRSILESKQI